MADDQEQIKNEGQAAHEEHGFSVGVPPTEGVVQEPQESDVAETAGDAAVVAVAEGPTAIPVVDGDQTEEPHAEPAPYAELSHEPQAEATEPAPADGEKRDKEPINFDAVITEYDRVKNLPLGDPGRQKLGQDLRELEESIWDKVRAEKDTGEADRLAGIAGQLLDMRKYTLEGRDRASQQLFVPYDTERLIYAVDYYNLIAEATSIKEMLERAESPVNPREAMGHGYDVAIQVAKNAVGSKRREVNALSNAETRDASALEAAERELDAAEQLLASLESYRFEVAGEEVAKLETPPAHGDQANDPEWIKTQERVWSN